MYAHRSGYHPSHEAISTHSRRRYRLTPTPNTNTNLPTCDTSLWIVHYARAESANQFPVNRIPVNAQVQSVMQQRAYLQRHGQLVRKEFMLSDRNNWPTVNLPPGPIPQYGQNYPGNVISHLSRNQHQAYLQEPRTTPGQQGTGPSPAKRPRPTPPTQRPGLSTTTAATVIALDPAIEEEEDYVRGDYLDLITPREISTQRYKQHHEWMDEVFVSPYATGQIMPVDLGLGRNGELYSLTNGFFDTPTGPTPKDDDKTHPIGVSRLENGRAQEFTKRATEKIAEISAEMEKMKQLHAKRMARLTKASTIREAEKKLRNAVVNTLDHGESLLHSPTETDLMVATIRQEEQIDVIAKTVETALKRKIEVVHSFVCVQKGGLEEKAQPEAVTSEANLPTTSLAAPVVATTAEDSMFPDIDEKPDWLQNDHDTTVDLLDIGDTPIQVDNDAEIAEQPSDMEPQDLVEESSDWVMVDRKGGADGNAAMAIEVHQSDILEDHATKEADMGKLGTELRDFSGEVPEIALEGFEGAEFDDTVDFGSLDTAGEALAGYGEQENAADSDDHMDLGLDDSAFGDAFHHTEPVTEAEGGGPF